MVVSLVNQHQVDRRRRECPDRGQAAKARANDDHNGTSVFHKALLSAAFKIQCLARAVRVRRPSRTESSSPSWSRRLAGRLPPGGVIGESTPLRGIDMVFQSYALFPNMTVRQNIAFGLKMQKRPPEVISTGELLNVGETVALDIAQEEIREVA